MRFQLFLVSLCVAGMANATPKVVTSIAPVHGLVEQIMYGTGQPTLLLSDTTSPHDFYLRPSQAQALEDADIIFSIGLNMEPWLRNPGRALFVELGETDGLHLLDARSLESFHRDVPEVPNETYELTPEYDPEPEAEISATDPDVESFVNDLIGDAQPISVDEDHDDHDEHDDHDFAGGIDPHIWLDPENAVIMAEEIARILIEFDQVNSEIYRDNVETVKAEIERAAAEAEYRMDRARRIKLITTHDSLQYLEHAYDLEVIGTFSSGTGVAAGLHAMADLYDQLGPNNCVLLDVSHPAGVKANTFAEIPIVEVDPLGSRFVGGSGYYQRLMEHLSDALSYCLG